VLVLVLDSDVDKFLNARPRAAPAVSAADAESKVAAATKLHGKGQTAKARPTGTTPVRCSDANFDKVCELYPPPSADSIPFLCHKYILYLYLYFVRPNGVLPLAPMVVMDDLLRIEEHADLTAAGGFDGWSNAFVHVEFINVAEFPGAVLKLCRLFKYKY
jgi:hypothetical protein